MSAKWGKVVTTDPLAVTLDGDQTAVTPVTKSLIDPTLLSVGDMVRAEHDAARRVIVLGVAGGTETVSPDHTHPLSDITVSALGAEDLDDIQTQGLYVQPSSGDATSGRHYPVARAGLLEVFNTPFSGGLFVFQRFTTRGGTDSNVDRTFIREYYLGWGDWLELVRRGVDGQPYAFAAGTVSGVTVNGGSVVRTTVTLPSGRFSQPPVVSPIRTNDYRDITVGVENVSASSFDLLRGHTTTSPTRSGVTAAWQAVQMTESSGAG